MPTQLCVRADAHSILRNILNYFSDNLSCIQELLQNARRAEASDVRVEIDSRTGSITVTDNGHGVIDPEDLLNIGKSEWNDGVKAERPAGMGLFSVFKLGGLAEVRSGRWRLTLDYDAMCAGKPAVYEGLQPNVQGTRVCIQRLHRQFGEDLMPHAETFAEYWAREAAFMPFRTNVVVDGKASTVEPFNPLAVPVNTLRVETAWGWIDLHHEAPDRGEAHHSATLIQQGVEREIKHHLYFSGHHGGPWVRIFAKPGTVNFTLPDRDKIQDDAHFRALLKNVRKACVDAVIARINDFAPEVQRRLADVVYGWEKLRVIELPAELQHIQIRIDREYVQRATRKEVAARLREGYLACEFEATYPSAFELVPENLLHLLSGEAELFRAMFPGTPVVTDIRFAISADERSDLLWRAGPITLKLDNGEERIVYPLAETAVLVNGELDAEFVPDDRERANFRAGNDFAVVHTCRDAVACPNLDPWYEWHDEAMSHDEAEELWRTSEYAVHLAATWPGVPACDVTVDELHTLLMDRFGSESCTAVHLKDAVLELEWGGRISVQSAKVEFLEAGEMQRAVELREAEGYLREVAP
jgi:hypothetical protein